MKKNIKAFVCSALLFGCGNTAVNRQPTSAPTVETVAKPIGKVSVTNFVQESDEYPFVPQLAAVDASALYWVEKQVTEDGSDTCLRIVKRDKINGWVPAFSGEMPTTLAEATNKNASIGAMVIVDEYLYWSESLNRLKARSLIRRMPRAGGVVENLVDTTDVADFVIFKDSLIWTEGGNSWWNTPQRGGVRSLDLKTRVQKNLVWGIKGADSVATDGDHVYFTTLAPFEGNGTIPTGNIFQIPFDGGERVLLASDEKGPQRLVVHSGLLYWLNNNSISDQGSVKRFDLKNRKMTTLIEKGYFHSLIADDKALYFYDDTYFYRVPLVGAPVVEAFAPDDGRKHREVKKWVSDGKSLYWIFIKTLRISPNQP